MRLPIAILLTAATVASAQDHGAAVHAFLEQHVKDWLGDPALIQAIKAQNARHADLTQTDIEALDQRWRAEVDAARKPLVDEVLGNALSQALRRYQFDSQGLITELIVMDDKGLNVGQSDVTSDYWQGDEAKWRRTYAVGPESVFIDEVEYDESSQRFQVQVSVPVLDPDTHTPIGAMTIGLDAEMLLN